MNIGFDASRAFIGNKTGTENYSYQILKHLVQLDHTNTYYIYLRPGVFYKGCPCAARAALAQYNNLKFITIPHPHLWTQVGLAKQTFLDKLDVLFIPAHTIPLVRKPGLKTVVTVHDLGAEYLPQAHQIKQRLYLNLMTHHQLKSASHIIAVSEATKNDLIKKVCLPKDKISVVYEGYDKDKFRVQSANRRTKFKINQTIKQYHLTYHNYFLFVGTIQPRKNIARLITAYAKFLKSYPNTKNEGFGTGSKYYVARDKNKKPLIHNTNPQSLVLAGSKGWLSDEIYELPKKLGIKDQVKFLGYIPDEDLPALYSGARAFLFPSLFEGFGLPILEAMAVGCPVLTSNVSSIPEVTLRLPKGHAALLVDPYSIEDIARGISKLSINHELRTKLTTLGFTQVKKFSWEKAAKETLVILEKVSKTK